VATILLCGVDLFMRGKLDALLPGHRLITADHTEDPELVLADVSRVDAEEVADTYPDVPIVGFTNHTDTAGLRAAHAAGFDQVLAKSALQEKLSTVVAELSGSPEPCVDVCPVDCIHEFDRILIIDPEECIDCGACEPECPVEAIFPEDALPDKWNAFVEINYAYDKGAAVVDELTQKYAVENNVQNEPIE
jgi:NAD-dependent dihydropyrimidine dehydrogenase PreA subunit